MLALGLSVFVASATTFNPTRSTRFARASTLSMTTTAVPTETVLATVRTKLVYNNH